MKRLRITVEGTTYEVDIELLEEGNSVPSFAALPSAAAATPSASTTAVAPVTQSAGEAGVPSPLAAVVVSVDVQVGQVVQEGDKLLTLEAMKMNTIVSAPKTGTVNVIHVSQGAAVEEGQALLDLV